MIMCTRARHTILQNENDLEVTNQNVKRNKLFSVIVFVGEKKSSTNLGLKVCDLGDAS